MAKKSGFASRYCDETVSDHGIVVASRYCNANVGDHGMVGMVPTLINVKTISTMDSPLIANLPQRSLHSPMARIFLTGSCGYYTLETNVPDSFGG